jgi:hypothetical protein
MEAMSQASHKYRPNIPSAHEYIRFINHIYDRITNIFLNCYCAHFLGEVCVVVTCASVRHRPAIKITDKCYPRTPQKQSCQFLEPRSARSDCTWCWHRRCCGQEMTEWNTFTSPISAVPIFRSSLRFHPVSFVFICPLCFIFLHFLSFLPLQLGFE